MRHCAARGSNLRVSAAAATAGCSGAKLRRISKQTAGVSRIATPGTRLPRNGFEPVHSGSASADRRHFSNRAVTVC